MPAEFAIEIVFEAETMAIKAQQEVVLLEQLPDNYYIEDRSDELLCIHENSPCKYASLDETVVNFLKPLLEIKESLRQLDAMLRVGLFFYLNETIVNQVLLNYPTIQLIEEFHLGIRVLCYPCGSEDDEDTAQ